MAEGDQVIEMTVGEPETIEIKVENKSSKTALTCKLCLDEILQNSKFTMEQCGCFFCTSCMQSYVEVLIKDGVVLSITCPDPECIIQGTLQVHEISLLAQSDTFEKYLKMKYEQEVAIDPHRTFCPNPSCSSICHICSFSDSEPKHKKKKKVSTATQQQPVKVSCPTCQLHFCHICKAEWVEDHSCSDPGHLVSNELMRFQAKTGLSLTGRGDAAIKRCPVCSVLIEKDRGCAQMICKNCSHVFCWYCLKLLDNDFMLRHYDKGPCKNFLGHSRAQVFRHRMGVISLFVAFTLLLIVASPILLLAAPIFLCCKWKECCQRAIRRAQQENNNSLFNETQNNSKQKPTELNIVKEVGGKEQRASAEALAQDPSQTVSETVEPTVHVAEVEQSSL